MNFLLAFSLSITISGSDAMSEPLIFYPQTDTFNADGPTVSSICEIE